jgi:hypothetical protein
VVGYRRRAVSVPRLALILAVALAALLAPSPAFAEECPGAGLLLYDGAVYSELVLPAGRTVAPAESLGSGQLAFLIREGEPSCDTRSRAVSAIEGVRPDVAVAVADRPSVFVLGARCAGFVGEDALDCVLAPLELDGRVYTGARQTGNELSRGATIGDASLGGETVTAVALAGVDPDVALAVDGHPTEVFVAAGSCPYERPAATAADDDLARCIKAPIWFVFDLERPPAARVGERVTARADRPVEGVVEGATVSLAKLATPADVVPADLADAVEIGVVDVGADGAVTLPITAPDLPTGVYEAVLTCEQCADAFGGQTMFAAGSLAILGDSGGGSGPRVIGIVLGALLIILAVGAVVAWRKRWWRPFGKGRRAPS